MCNRSTLSNTHYLPSGYLSHDRNTAPVVLYVSGTGAPDIFVSLLPLLTVPLVLLVRGDNAIIVFGLASWSLHRLPFFTHGLARLASCSPRADICRLSHHFDSLSTFFPFYIHLSHFSTSIVSTTSDLRYRSKCT